MGIIGVGAEAGDPEAGDPGIDGATFIIVFSDYSLRIMLSSTNSQGIKGR